MIALLSIFGDLENLFSDHIYPNRLVLAPIIVAAVAIVAALAYRWGLHLLLWRHRTASVLVGTPLLLLAFAAGYYTAAPLFERNRLDEASPLEMARLAPDTGQAAGAPMERNETRITLRGMFKGADEFHFGRGDALVIRTETGSNVLRFENFSVRNGPDLYVYLSRDESGKRLEEALNLGRLKATDGAFNYELPSNVDLSGVKSVVVWCRQFAVQFAVAPLM